MKQYIDKDALVAKIERMIKHYNESVKEFGDEGYNDNVLMEQCKANACEHILSFLNTLKVKEMQEEPVSEELEEACEQLAENARKHKAETSSPFFSQTDYKQGVIAGAKWQKQQFEKNRLAHCDAQTGEEAEIERDFVMSIIEKEHRQPTFDDAIKYGMRLQKEQLMASGTDVTVHIEAGNYPYIPQIELYDYDKDIPLAKEGDKYKVIRIKQD